jgi:aquaporin Z
MDTIDGMFGSAASRVPGRPGGEIVGTDKQGGWHWVEWSCELAGTALLLLGGLSAVCLDFSPGSPIESAVPSHSARLLITGLLFAGSGSLVAISPLGRRSGAHLNPAVSVAFWRRGHMHSHDLAGYVAAQVAGAFTGTALVRWWWGAKGRAVHLGVTRPGHGIDAPAAAGIEALMTLVLVAAILVMVSSATTARWTPLLVWIVVAVLVWQGAPWTGTSLNPARSLAPALLLPETANLWVYVVGPLAGSLLAVQAFDLVPGLETRTAKLFHDRRYPSTMATTLRVPPR